MSLLAFFRAYQGGRASGPHVEAHQPGTDRMGGESVREAGVQNLLTPADAGYVVTQKHRCFYVVTQDHHAAIPPLDGVKWICKKCHFASHHPHHERHAWDRLLVGLRFPEPVSSMTSRTHPDRGARVRPAGRSFNRPRGGVFCAERVSKVGRDLFDPVPWRSRLSP